MINKTMAMKNKIIAAAKHLSKMLVQTPLLLGWIIIGTIIEFTRNGHRSYKYTIINLVLLASFTLIIKIMTDNPSVKLIPKLKYPRLELFSGILLYIYIVIELSILWNNVPSIEKIIDKSSSIGVPQWLAQILVNASFSIVLQLIPIIILFVLWGYGFKKMGFIFSNLPLILVLVGVTIILGLPSKLLFQQPFYKTILTFLIMIFINALPEELFIRGYLLPRLEVVLKNPINALVITAILFNMLHIPSELAKGMNIYQALLFSFSMVYPSGLIWGYLYLKTRSIVPGIIWHASDLILGMIFF